MSSIDLCLRRWYHRTAMQRAATTKAQFRNKLIAWGEGTGGSQEGKKLGARGEINVDLSLNTIPSKAQISAAYPLQG